MEVVVLKLVQKILDSGIIGQDPLSVDLMPQLLQVNAAIFFLKFLVNFLEYLILDRHHLLHDGTHIHFRARWSLTGAELTLLNLE